ncbi:MAG: isoleucine--tRNA ligase [Desulfovibrionaceae bacterium]|nr:isoleucine--tRNA ligase [Desulfovibrionaceae bacterium]
MSDYNYKKTLHLPKTSFPMKANLKQKEPEMLAHWAEIRAYEEMVAAGDPSAPYVLHDGPPYANGHIHLGTALNKIIKDIIVKSRNMMGQRAEYVPGWDCHGLPIELKAEQELGGKKDLPVLQVRKLCREFALRFLDIQREEFKRLGVFGVWDEPYRTLNPVYEAATARELGNFMAQGSVVRSKKPIYWCNSCQTALAEAEVEYENHTSPSIYVRFPFPDEGLRKVFPQADPARTYVVIWTTTPWTIPDNMGVCLHPDFDYTLVKNGEEFYLFAEHFVSGLKKLFGWPDAEVLGTCKGVALERLVARHPIYGRDSLVVLGDHVTLEAGTGCVHTAPGHGREDYEVGLKYGLEIYSPLTDEGRFMKEVEFFAGLTVFEANPKVIDKLTECGNLLHVSKITHSYPHCWRCKKPVIFRATTQWFISMDKNELRQRALSAIMEDVRWIPSWGRERIYSMIENRPDWCISRQRMWGVPIVALLCEECDHAYFDHDWVNSVVAEFESFERGCDWWFETPLEKIVPQGLKCPKCGSTHWRKETDILDVWFDSGTSFAAVLEKRKECAYPADMYLEGSDQHRGWFHSSLLASVGTRGRAPYKNVLTHGYVVDGEGKKMSKSVGNVVAPQEIIDKYGAEILRMWVSSVDYREDVRISDEILSRLVDAYRRIRNTCRFMLGNLEGFAAADAVGVDYLDPLDRYALDIVHRTHQRIQEAYEEYEFHKVFHAIHNLCVTDLSAFYLDVLKDRLYVPAENDKRRRSAQTVLWRTLLLLVQDMAPILSFLAEEVFSHLPAGLKPALPTVFALRSALLPETLTPETRAVWEQLMRVRAEVTRAIEPRRQSGEVGHSLDCAVTLYCADDLAKEIRATEADLRELFIVSRLTIADLAEAPAEAFTPEDFAALRIGVAPAAGEKCQRCWVRFDDLGSDPEHPALCARCTAVVHAEGTPEA